MRLLSFHIHTHPLLHTRARAHTHTLIHTHTHTHHRANYACSQKSNSSTGTNVTKKTKILRPLTIFTLSLARAHTHAPSLSHTHTVRLGRGSCRGILRCRQRYCCLTGCCFFCLHGVNFFLKALKLSPQAFNLDKGCCVSLWLHVCFRRGPVRLLSRWCSAPHVHVLLCRPPVCFTRLRSRDSCTGGITTWRCIRHLADAGFLKAVAYPLGQKLLVDRFGLHKEV